MKTWSYYINPFMLLGLSSFTKAVKISAFTDEKLFAQTADPFIAAQYALYHPLHVALVAAYNLWVANGGTQKGSTALVNLLFKQLVALVEGWDITVQTHFRKGTPDYITIFPHGHNDFSHGTIEERIGALSSLFTRLTPYSIIAAVKTAVDAEHTTLENARIAQEGNKGITDTASHTVEHAVTEAMTGMFAFYGAGINQFAADPMHIAPFFDEATIRNPHQTEFTNHCPAGAHKNIFKRTMPHDTLIKCTNTGTAEAYFYFAHNKNDNVNVPTAILLAPGADVSLPATEYGYTEDNTHTYFNVANAADVDEANFTIDIM